MADPPIEPEDWDTIVVGSGLAQCLVASALAKAGRSVLLIDPEDTYGSEGASFTLEALRQAALGVQDVSLTAEPASSSSAAGSQAAHSCSAHAAGQEQAAAAAVPASSGPQLAGVLAVPLPRFQLPLHGVQGYALPSEAQAKQAPGSYVLDLLPKMLYQAEPLVDLLVRCRAHHYLEFKRVEGSYLVAAAAAAAATAPLRFAAAGATVAAASSSAGAAALSSAAATTQPPAAAQPPATTQAPTAAAQPPAAAQAPAAAQPPTSVPRGAAAAAAAAPTRPYVLRPIPSSKSDIFKDKTLGLGDKRSLMGFLGAAVEAVQGGGRLKDVLSSDTPLADVLTKEGVSPGLRSIVLHGIAMCDVVQEPTDAVQEPAGASAPPAAPSHAQPVVGRVATHTLSAREGAASLQLLMESTARFGGPGAFMVPSWGCGSVPEAFVRCCAVAGGTTVLRCRGAAVLLAPGAAGESCEEGAAPAGGVEAAAEQAAAGQAAAAAAEQAAAGQDEVQGQAGAEAGGGRNQECQIGQGDVKGEAAGSSPHGQGAASGCGDGRWRVSGIVTSIGQVLSCKHLVAGAEACRSLADALSTQIPPQGTTSSAAATTPSTAASTSAATNAASATTASSSGAAPALPLGDDLPEGAAVYRALVIMDGSLVEGQSNLTLLFPPRCALLGGCNPHPIRALQLGPTLGVCPSKRYLLYLSTVAESYAAAAASDRSAAVRALQPAVQVLLQSESLQPLAAATKQPDTAAASGSASASALAATATATAAASAAAGVAAGPGGAALQAHQGAVDGVTEAPASEAQAPTSAEEPATKEAAAAASADARPGALQAYYYQQRLQQGPGQASLPDNAMCAAACSLSALGLVGHLSSVSAAEAAFRSHFPGVTWLSEIDPDAGAGADPDDEDGDAIDALQAALGNLSSDQAASAS